MSKISKKAADGYDGTAQVDRMVAALSPRSILVDERPLSDLLAIAREFADFVRFYNLEGLDIGTWRPFFEKDSSFFIASLLAVDPRQWDDRIRAEIRSVFDTYIPADSSPEEEARWLDQKKEAVIRLITGVIDLAFLLNDWYTRSKAISGSASCRAVADVLAKAIVTELGAYLQLINRWLATLPEVVDLHFPPPLQRKIEQFDAFWAAHPADETLGYVDIPGTVNEKLNLAVEDFREAYEQLSKTMNYLLDRAPEWLRDTLEKEDDHQPDMGLIMAFFKVYDHARNDLNELTLKHLNHYYFDRLHLEKKPPVPDWTVVAFTLADGERDYLVPAGTRLLAGVNAEGLESHYATEAPLLVSAASIAALKTIYVSKNPLVDIGSSYRLISGVFAAPVANSSDGLGLAFVRPATPWPLFGEEQMNKASDERTMQNAQIGWVIAAPVLGLSQGYRKIQLQFEFEAETYGLFLDLIEDIAANRDAEVPAVINRLFANAIHFYATGPEGWFPVSRVNLVMEGDEWSRGILQFHLQLALETPPLIERSPALAAEGYDTHWPALKMVLVVEEANYIYSFLRDLLIDKITIRTQVEGLTNLQLMNDSGPLDPSAPFFPFGPAPALNSYLLVGHIELFKKKLRDLSIHLRWNNLPEDESGLKEYYAAYGDRLPVDNESYRVRLSALSDHHFKPLKREQQQKLPLFSAAAADGPLEEQTTWDQIDLAELAITPDYQRDELPEFNNDLRSGYFKLQLAEPTGMFGHKRYPGLFAEAMLANAQPKNKEKKPLPNEPFTPVVRDISIAYEAEAVLNFREMESRENDQRADERVYHLHPFGIERIFAQGRARKRQLVTRFDYDGYLFLGLRKLHPPQALDLFFDIEESKRRFSRSALEVDWAVLYEDEWVSLGKEEIIADGTDLFTAPGIVSLDLPATMTRGNTRFAADLYWIRIAARGNMDIIGAVRAIVPHAVAARWVDNGDVDHYNPEIALPPLQGMVAPVPAIAAARQLIPFRGRHSLESTQAFYIRSSERLRHKNRGINSWDWEHLILEAFPDIQQVRCVGAFLHEKDYDIRPGHAKVVVVPRIDGKDNYPKVGFQVLKEIEAFIKSRISTFVQVDVVNPLYERVKVNCGILLQDNLYASRGRYLKQLEAELRRFVCPWLSGGAVHFGGTLVKKEVLGFIKSRPYVKFVSGFSLVQVYEDIFMRERNYYDLDDTATAENKEHFIRATTPWSILVPVAQHTISFLKNESYIAPEITAMEGMQLGTDFIVVRGEEDEDIRTFNEDSGRQSPDEEEDWFLTF